MRSFIEVSCWRARFHVLEQTVCGGKDSMYWRRKFVENRVLFRGPRNDGFIEAVLFVGFMEALLFVMFIEAVLFVGATLRKCRGIHEGYPVMKS